MVFISAHFFPSKDNQLMNVAGVLLFLLLSNGDMREIGLQPDMETCRAEAKNIKDQIDKQTRTDAVCAVLWNYTEEGGGE